MSGDFVVPRRARMRAGAAALAVAAVTAASAWSGLPTASAAGKAADFGGKPCTPTGTFINCRVFEPEARAAQEFQVPAGVTALDVRAWGAGGADSALGGGGGAGGYVSGTAKVTAGEKLKVVVAAQTYGDARGGNPGSGGSYASNGGGSSAIRSADGAALIVAGGGGGSGVSEYGESSGRAGDAGGENGEDSAFVLGGKGAKGAQGGEGGGNGAAGADHSASGAGGDGGDATGDGGNEGGGGGGGYAGGGGGGGADRSKSSGAGGGGSSYANPDRVTEAQLVAGKDGKAPKQDDPFYRETDNPIEDSTAQGGGNSGGGAGRVVVQWSGALTDELAPVSGQDQIWARSEDFDPFAVVARDKDGKPVEGVAVTFTFDDPNDVEPLFDAYPEDVAIVETDEQGRAQSPKLWFYGGSTYGAFKVRAKAQGKEAVFSAERKQVAYDVKITAGDKQTAEAGKAFPEALEVHVTESGEPAANTRVRFKRYQQDGPHFADGVRLVDVKTDSEGNATAPELFAGTDVGENQNLSAYVGEAEAVFTFEVVEAADSTGGSGDSGGTGEAGGSGDGGAGGSDSGTSGSSDSSGTSGPSDSDGGLLASTGGWTGLGLLLGAGIALVGLGLGAVRFVPRLRAQGRI
ncbi:hypothetical protein [Streptomyces sp. N35]|uniref:hypothetical protein n=1 Tax=Streptomyces sp. N35 TaxID=2795730 RepID=UPI0018F34850|nr:hypothetical protein [Streptomyces sp. N35]